MIIYELDLISSLFTYILQHFSTQYWLKFLSPPINFPLPDS